MANEENSEDFRWRDYIQRIVFLLFILGVLIASTLVIHGFLQAIILAALVAALGRKPFEWLNKKLKEKAIISSFLMTLFVLIVLFLPLTLLLVVSIRQLIDLSQQLNASGDQIGEIVDRIISKIESIPFAGEAVRAFEIDPESFGTYVREQIGGILQVSGAFATETLRFGLLFIIFVFCLFYFFKDGKHVYRWIHHLVPFSSRDKDLLMGKVAGITRATIKGYLIFGIVQGLIGGLTFFFLGLPIPVVIGLIYALLGAIPGLGAVLVWLPTITVLIALAEYGKAIIVFIFGAVLLAVLEYVIRTYVIREDTQLHEVLALLGILGGIAAFGILGILFGPIIMAILVQSLQLFGERYSEM